MQEIFPHAFTLENYRVIFEKPRVLKPLLNSLKMSAIAVAVGLLITVPSSYMLVKYKNKFHTFLKVLLLLPWTMPASVVAINLINAFGQETIILAGGVLVLIRTIGEYTMSALLYGVFNRPISISMVTNMQEYKVGISLAYGVIVIAICYVALAVIFKLDKKRFL